MSTLKQKVETYERVLHDLQMHYEVTGNDAQLRYRLDKISNWSYAHRTGIGMLSKRKQNKLIKDAFNKLI